MTESRRVTAEGALGAMAKIMPFGTAVFAAFVPFAAGSCPLTSGAWAAVERAVPRRRIVRVA
ncbi:hypothetical protein [Actinomadura monticuli]|uniref:Uncharacterized protein n=1 Tax=Actinomadura monticuli TaxID=3097367 RepID=A0ABV4Q6E1_9ACTN